MSNSSDSALLFTGTAAATASTLYFAAPLLATPLAPLAIASIAIGAAASMVGALSQKRALEVQKEQAKIRSEQDSLKRDEKMERIIAQQNVSAASEGVSAGSFAALEMDSFKQFAEDQRISDLNSMMQTKGIEIQQSNVFEEAFAKSVSQAAQTIYMSEFGGTTKSSKQDVFS